MSKLDNRQLDNLLDEAQLLPDPKFTKQLQQQLIKKEKSMNSQSTEAKSSWRKLLAGAGAVSAVAVLAVTLIGLPGQQVVSAKDAYDLAKSQPNNVIMLDSLYETTKPGGNYLQMKTSQTLGPRADSCLSINRSGTSTTQLFAEGNSTELLLMTETGPKATEPFMLYDTNTEQRIATQFIPDQTSYTNFLLDNATFVNTKGKQVPANTEVPIADLNGQEVYRLLIAGPEGYCDQRNQSTIVELMVNTYDGNILRDRVFQGTVNSKNLVATRTVTSTQKAMSRTDAIQLMKANGFKTEQAKTAARELQDNQLDLYGVASSVASGTWSQNNPDQNEYGLFVDFASRPDLKLVMLDRNAQLPSADGLPSGLWGYTVSTRNGSKVYTDTFDKQMGAQDAIISGEITEFKVDGKPAIKAIVEGTYTGQGKQVMTIIKTGDKDYPAIAIVEDLDQHLQHISDWQLFIDSINF